MEYREFGQTGLKVSAIGFGCWELGGGYGSIDDAEVVAAVNRAIDLGINCFDTAQGYGSGASERLLARALGPRRKDVILVTKFGIGYEQGRDSSKEMVHRAIEQSLEMLNTDYVDVYLVHWPDRDTPFEETMGASGGNRPGREDAVCGGVEFYAARNCAVYGCAPCGCVAIRV